MSTMSRLESVELQKYPTSNTSVVGQKGAFNRHFFLQKTIAFSIAVPQAKPTSRSAAAAEEQISREEQKVFLFFGRCVVVVGRCGAGEAAEGDDVQRRLARESAHQERQALPRDGRQAGQDFRNIAYSIRWRLQEALFLFLQ